MKRDTNNNVSNNVSDGIELSAVTNVSNLPLALTVLEAGQVLRVGRSVTYELVRSGQLRSVRIGRSIRIPRDALVEYLQLAS